MKPRYIPTIILLILVSLTMTAQNRGGVIYRNSDTGEYCAAVKTDLFIGSAATQQNENWCWAACIQMVLQYQGVSITQNEIVTSVFGWPVDRGGTAWDIVKAVNNCNRGLVAKAEQPSTKSKNSFVDDLAKRYPLIVGLDMPGQSVGHAFVMTGITFTVSSDGHQIYPRSVILRNPWPFRDGQQIADRQELEWSDFNRRVHTIVHVYPR